MLKAVTVSVIAMVSIALPSIGLSEDAYPTNLELVEQAVRVAVDSMDVRPPAGVDPYLEIEAGTGSEASWLLDSILKEELLNLGWRVKAASGGVDSAESSVRGFLLRLRVVELGLQYGRSWRRYLFAGQVVQRLARASIYYELIDRQDDRIVASSNVRSEKSDVVPASLLPTLSNSDFQFASPELERGQWDRYLEGGLVIAIIGVLIYLFYSNKTAT
jgi:hypothetical protein